jgi:uncharacterized membrane protein YccC
MGKDGAKDPVAKARKKVARAQNRYLKAVAKGERQIRNVRALVDEQIARAKAEFELRANELADAERHGAVNGGAATPEAAADVLESAVTQKAKADPLVVQPNGSVPKSRPKSARPAAKSRSGTTPKRSPQKKQE